MSDCAILIKEIQSLPPSSLGAVLDFVGYLKGKNQKAACAMEKAADVMAAEYASDPELTAFCALDGEGFYEAR